MPTKFIPAYGDQGSLSLYADFADQTSPPSFGPWFLNGYFESSNPTIDDYRKVAFTKRPGLIQAKNFPDIGGAHLASNLTGLTNNYKIRGCASTLNNQSVVFFLNNGTTNKAYSFITNSLTDKGVCPAAAGSWSATTGVAFTILDGVSYGAGNYFAVTDQTKGATLDINGTWTEITNANFTGLTKCTNFAALDGYLFIGTTNNRIYNCDLNTPGTWTATSFLTSADTPGSLLWLEKIRNYLVAFKQNSIEFYEDTGNPTPGSPLTAVKQLNVKYGVISADSIKEVSDGFIFAGTSPTGMKGIYKLSKDTLRVTKISDYLIDQLCANLPYLTDWKATSLGLGGNANIINHQGKEFYTISLRNRGETTNPNWKLRTFVWDNQLNAWTIWASSLTADNTLDQTFSIDCVVNYNRDANQPTIPLLACNSFVDASHPAIWYTLSNTSLADQGSAGTNFGYPLLWQTDVMNFGSAKRKFMDKLKVYYETNPTVATNVSSSNHSINLVYRDSLYNAVSPNVAVSRTLQYENNNNISGRCYCTRLGSFRQRALTIKQTDTSTYLPFKLYGVEVDINIGETDQQG